MKIPEKTDWFKSESDALRPIGNDQEMVIMHTNRREFLKKIAALTIITGFVPAFGHNVKDDPEGKIVTVTGAILPGKMGVSLIHEHVMSTFGEEKKLNPGYDTEKLFAQVLPYLKKIRSLGCQTIVECTAAYFGRDPIILQKLSQQSGLYIITNTGYYGAANDRYVPDHALKEDAETIAQHWIREWEQGIGDTGIRPGFIKTGIDQGALSETDAKLVRAAAKTHLQTGLTTACHTGNNKEAMLLALEILREEGVSPNAWIWTHAHQAARLEDLFPAAKQGAWISLDGVRIEQGDNEKPSLGGEAMEKHLSYLVALKKKGYLNRTLISHDGNSFTSSKTDTIRPFDAIFTHLVPRLQDEGFSKKEINQLLVVNPKEAFKIRIRK